MIKLTELINLGESEEFKQMDIFDQILIETYIVIAENIDLNNAYEYEQNGFAGSWFWLVDKHNIRHEIKLNLNPTRKPTLTVKFYWIDENNKPNYNKPPYTDEKVFNKNYQ